MAEKKERKSPAIPEKGKERKRKEKLVKKRNELREKEKRKKEKEERRKEKGERKKEKEEKRLERLHKKAEPLIYVQVFEGGRKYETHTSVKMGMRKPWRKPNPEEICSAIPGSVMSLFVNEGDPVERGQQIMVYEAMKMRNVIRAPFAGVVMQIMVKVGDKLPRGVPMIVIRSSESPETEPVHGSPDLEGFE